MPDHLLFITGKLAEPALRRTLTELAPQAGFTFEVAVMPITVAALLTTEWIARRLAVPPNTTRIILPGLCRGELETIQQHAPCPVQRGPNQIQDLPQFFGQKSQSIPYGKYDIEILAEINHAPQLSLDTVLALARKHRKDGADWIDLGCDPGSTWHGISEYVQALVADGCRVSVDSFNPTEVRQALEAGAELVLSVNTSNLHHALTWREVTPHLQVVAIPDSPKDTASLRNTVDQLRQAGIAFRIDPILEPIGFGFAASLGRYLHCRQEYPDAEIMMGIGNLTELTDVDSAGLNVMLLGFCQELGIRSVLTTQVINWARTSVKELDLARRLVHFAVSQNALPKHREPRLVQLRDPRLTPLGEHALRELAEAITDPNYRIFAENGEIHIMNNQGYVRGTNPFTLFRQLQSLNPRLDPSHSFYLGYELAKAVTALTLHKQYTQDRALNWGILTLPEPEYREDDPHPPVTTE